MHAMHDASSKVRQWCEAAGLTLHPTKTRIVDVRTEGFDFLGYRVQTTSRGRLTRWPRKLSERLALAGAVSLALFAWGLREIRQAL